MYLHLVPKKREHDATHPIPHSSLWLSALLRIQDCKLNGFWQQFETARFANIEEIKHRNTVSPGKNSIANFNSIDSAISLLLKIALFS